MDRWIGKVALVTGASSGIGAAIAVDLTNAGMIVIGAARRQTRIDQLKDQITDTKRNNLHSFKCDVSKEEDIKAVFQWIDEKFGGLDVLVNNAGTNKVGNLLEMNDSAILRSVIDTNLLGAALCCREAFKSMKKKGVDGHLILINSILGHYTPYWVGSFPSINIYNSTKYGLTAMTEVLRQELQILNSKTKITSISPGSVKTEIFTPEFLEQNKNIPFLESKDIAAAVLYVLGTPPRVQVHELIIKPVGEIF